MSYWSERLEEYLKRRNLTRRQLALELGISINTVKKWWGSREPSAEHAARIRQLLQESSVTAKTTISGSFVSPEQELQNAESTETKKTQKSSYYEASGDSGARDFSAGKGNEGLNGGQIPEGLQEKGGRYRERSVVISLQRNECPFCEHELERFYNCKYCGQHFVWANIPLENDK